MAGGATPPASAARSRPSSAQPRPSSAQPRATRCGSCGSCVSRPGSASYAGPVTDGGASERARPASAALGRGAAGRSSTVTRATSVPALQLGRLHDMARVQTDTFAPRSPRITLLSRPLSAAARGERPSGHAAPPMAAAAMVAAASTRAAAYLPTKVVSVVPDALREQSWLPIYTGHALPPQDRDHGFEYVPLTGDQRFRVGRVEATLKMESSLLIGGEAEAEEAAEADAEEAVESAASAEAEAEERAEARAEAEARAKRSAPAPVGWLSHDFPTHTAGPPRQQAEGLRHVMLRLEQEMEREMEREIAISDSASAQISSSAERGSEVPALVRTRTRARARARALIPTLTLTRPKA